LNCYRGGLHTTSDFPEILANVAGKTLRRAYEAAPQTFRPIVREVEVADFKEVSRVQLGDAPSLEKVNEHGEFKRGTIGEGAEKYKVETYGKVIGITRQTLINDDLDAFTRVPTLFGRAAADLESDLVWGIMIQNPKMADGVDLFHGTHENLGSAAAIGETSLTAMRAAMRKQKGLNGRLLNLMPAYLMVPAVLETEAKKFLNREILANKAQDVNVFAGSMELIVEPRLDEGSLTAWYTAASTGQIDIIELAYLQGQRGVFLQSREGFDVDGLEIKARLDVAAKAIDFRGLFKNPGA
jgi:hypothetical protein